LKWGVTVERDIKKVLLVEDNKELAQKYQGAIHVYVDSDDYKIETFIAYRYHKAIEIAKTQDIDCFSIDVNLNEELDGIDLAKYLRENGYTYEGIIFVTEKNRPSSVINILTSIPNSHYFSKPLNLEDFSGQVRYILNGPSFPKKKYLPTFRHKNTKYTPIRELTLYLRKSKLADKVEIGMLGEKEQFRERLANLESFKKLKAQIITPAYKEFMQCNRNTIINTTKIIEMNKTEHYLLLEGCDEKIWVDPSFRTQIYEIDF
jgi:DNA-binding response OmpR family regulator